MSRMTKFLKQICSLERAKRDSKGEVQLDAYGEAVYASPRRVKCRREKRTQDVQTGNGAILRSYTCYFVDATIPVEANDKLDGRVVLEVSEYVNQLGKIEGYEAYV